jgi:hypothetical protein
LQTSELWDIGKKGVKSHFETASRDLGIVDHTNQCFVELAQMHMNEDQTKQVNQLELENQLFNPFLKLKGETCLYSSTDAIPTHVLMQSV